MKIDGVAVAFRFEMAALDLRLRAERIVEAAKQLNVDTLNNDELDHALDPSEPKPTRMWSRPNVSSRWQTICG